MSWKRAGRRRATKNRATHKDTLSLQDEAQVSTVAMLLALAATDPATAYVAQHGPCTLCRVRVGVVTVQFTDAARRADGPDHTQE